MSLKMKDKNPENGRGNEDCSSLIVLMIAAFFLISACFAGFAYAEDKNGGVKITEVPGTHGTIKITEIPGPDGTTKITEIPGPDGVTKITNLPSGANITNLPSGTNITNLPSGANITNLPSGTNITNLPGGTNITNLPGGTNITNLPDGTTVTTFPDGTKVLKLPGKGLWNRLVEGVFSIIYGVLILGLLISLAFFAAGFKTKNNLFYIAGAGTLLITGALYFSYPSYETPEIPGIPAEPASVPETLSPLQQLDLLLANADKNKNSGDVAAEKLDLMNALDISLKNNLPEKTEIIETKLSDTTRREATDHRRFGKPEDAVKSADDSIKYNPKNPWAYVEGIINSEELEKHGDAVNYGETLDEIETTAETATTGFPVDTKTADEYKDYAVNFNNDGTAEAKTAETLEDIGNAIYAVKTGADYLGEALIIAETLDLANVKNTPTATAANNLVSANNNLIVLQMQAGDFNAAKNAADEALKIIEEHDDIVPGTVKSGVLSNTATVYALSGDYNRAVDYAKNSLSISPENAGANNVIASSLTAIGGKNNVMEALPYSQKSVDLDPENEIYKNNLKTIQEAVANEDWYDIEINFGVNVLNLATCCVDGTCLKQNEENCKAAGGRVVDASSCYPDPCADGGNEINKLLNDLEKDKNFAPGRKIYYPFTASDTMNKIIETGSTAVPYLEERLSKSTDPGYKKAILFILIHIDDPLSEEILINSLDDEELRGIAIYLLGNYFYRTPELDDMDKSARNKERVLDANSQYLYDTAEYTFAIGEIQENVQIRDLAIASYIRTAGPELGSQEIFNTCTGRWIGLEIPHFTEEDRCALISEITGSCEECECCGDRSCSYSAYAGCNLTEVELNVSNGTFVFEYNTTKRPNRLVAELNFTANVTSNCTKILFIQSSRMTFPNGSHFGTGDTENHLRNRSTAGGWIIDRADGLPSPYYGTLDNTTNSGSNSKPGSRTSAGTNTSWMYDAPGNFRPRPFTMEFETCAVCAEGSDKCACYGCVTWSFTVNAGGSVTMGAVSSSSTPSQNWKDAMEKWNEQSGNRQANHCL